ncbi:MAG: stage II sporulation protein M [Candidatus Nanoarchaeia archaeon]|nr:stage II sporulation protein M [Candidatus Nanoarchaeia archaeon]
MVLESLLSPSKAKNNPWALFFLGIVYSSVAILLSLWVFPNAVSLSSVFLTTIASIPLIVAVLRKEAADTEEDVKKKKYFIIGEHMDIFRIFTCIFMGFLVSYILWASFTPEPLFEIIFGEQIFTINTINSNISGKAVAGDIVGIILINNLKVLAFCVLFSFLYGAGAVFILTWNASVIAAAIGNIVRENLSRFAGSNLLTAYFQAIPLGFARYMTHGFFEMMAYFFGGIAGGLISAAVIRHRLKSEEFVDFMTDSVNLIIVACLLLIIGALIEISVSPLIGV